MAMGLMTKTYKAYRLDAIGKITEPPVDIAADTDAEATSKAATLERQGSTIEV